jgi:hypothetical protein
LKCSARFPHRCFAQYLRVEKDKKKKERDEKEERRRGRRRRVRGSRLDRGIA